MYKFLLVVHAIIAAAMVGTILMQRSEGGGLAGGGSPSGLMTARGAADFLTRATTILASLFVLLSIGLAGLATDNLALVPDALTLVRLWFADGSHFGSKLSDLLLINSLL